MLQDARNVDVNRQMKNTIMGKITKLKQIEKTKRILLALDMLPKLQVEAKIRMYSGVRGKRKGKASEIAGLAVKINADTIQNAINMQNNQPHLIDMMRCGEIMYQEAYQIFTGTVSPPKGYGYFYIALTVPDLSDRRVKIGWTSRTPELRLKEHCTLAPNIKVLKSWICKYGAEQKIIQETMCKCKQIGGYKSEVYDTPIPAIDFCNEIEQALNRLQLL